MVSARCGKLGISCKQGLEDKLAGLRQWAKEQGVGLSGVVYVGNDVNDLACLQAAGCGVTVSNAYPEAKSHAKIILSTAGGEGALREICDLIMEKNKDAGKTKGKSELSRHHAGQAAPA